MEIQLEPQDSDSLRVYVAVFVSHPPAQVMFKRVDRCAPRLATALRSPLRTPLRPARPSAAAAGGVRRPRCDRRDRWSRPTRVRDPGVTGPGARPPQSHIVAVAGAVTPRGGRDAGVTGPRGPASTSRHAAVTRHRDPARKGVVTQESPGQGPGLPHCIRSRTLSYARTLSHALALREATQPKCLKANGPAAGL